MTNFINWLKNEAPESVQFLFTLSIIISAVMLVILSVVAIASGYWIFPVVGWSVLPMAIVLSAYLKERGDEDETQKGGDA